MAGKAALAFPDDVQNGGVRDEIAPAHEIHRRLQRGAALAAGETFGGPEDVAGGEVARAQTRAEEFGLSTFADTRRAEEDEAEGPGVMPWRNGATRVAALEPYCTIVFFVHINIVC